ncbi:unnamed protein product [Euphydryas editha]|uniref:Tc1-like transposase DDE domain-containing protein n=1 Tax=Euphydryas editha TaxID=104508 RepID=A0AAU9UPQ0_EUPED|nr:unnamed protein product [Euphydryas editha]
MSSALICLYLLPFVFSENRVIFPFTKNTPDKPISLHDIQCDFPIPTLNLGDYRSLELNTATPIRGSSTKVEVVEEERNIALWTHPPYSPDLNPLDYGFFGKLKRMLRGDMFNSWDQLTNS